MLDRMDYCAIEDSLDYKYENKNGKDQIISATNQNRVYCDNKGKKCPIYEEYILKSKSELIDFYDRKAFYFCSR